MCGYMDNGYWDEDACKDIKPENFHQFLTFFTFLLIPFSCSFLGIS